LFIRVFVNIIGCFVKREELLVVGFGFDILNCWYIGYTIIQACGFKPFSLLSEKK
jgi:hypothetical protein